MRSMTVLSILAAALSLGPSPALAGPFANDLAKCLVRSTTPAEKTELMRWMFVAIDQHPAVRVLAQVPQAEQTVITKRAAALFQHLLVVSCRTQARQAIKYEGPASIRFGFQILGAVAARGLFTDPHVIRYVASMMQYTNKNELAQALKPPQPAGK